MISKRCKQAIYSRACKPLVVIRAQSLKYCFTPTCGSLGEIGSHKLIGRDTVRRCGFVAVGMALLEKVSYCGL